MAHEQAKGQQAEKLFLGSLRASRAIKNQSLFRIAFDLSYLPLFLFILRYLRLQVTLFLCRQRLFVIHYAIFTQINLLHI